MTPADDAQPAPDAQPPEPRPPGATNPAPPRIRAAVGETARAVAGVEGIIQDIRREIADISTQELDLRRREQEFQQQYRRLEEAARRAARAEVEEAQRHLAQRSAALNAQAAEVVLRRQRLDSLGEQLQLQEDRLRHERAEVEQRAERSRRRVASVGLRLGQRREILRKRITLVRQHEQELERRTQLARDDIVARREGLQRREVELRQWAEKLENVEHNLNQRWEELEERLTSEAARLADAQRQAQEVSTQHEQLASERQGLKQAADNLQAERAALTERHRELDQRWQELREQRHRVTRQAEELEARRRALQQEQVTVEERVKRLAQREQQLNERLAGLATERAELAELEGRLAKQRAANEEARARAEQIEKEAREYHSEALALRTQMEARDGESRQAALALEVEREEFARRKAAEEAAGEELDRLRGRREQDLSRARDLLAAQAARVRAAQRSFVAAPRLWWLRAAALALLVGALTAAVWLLLHPPLYHAAVELRITSQRPATSAPAEGPDPWALGVLAEHRRALLDADLLNDVPAARELAGLWRRTCTREDVNVVGAAEAMTLRLSATAPDEGRLARLVQTAADVYAERVNRVPAEATLPRQYQEVLAWRDALAAELDEARLRHSADRAARDSTPAPADRVAAAAEADRLETELAALGGTLEQQRAALAALVAAEVPPGRVDPADVADTLADDAIFQEDRKEFHANVLKYRNELVVAMLLLTEPVKAVQKAVEDYAKSIAEQRAVEPPAELVATLEAGAAGAARMQGLLAGFGVQWRTWVEQLRELELTEAGAPQGVGEIVRQQGVVAEAARKLADECVKFVDEDGARVERLDTDGDGSTREVVVAAVLRGDHGAVAAAVETLVAATGKLSPAENIELDAIDRQLRRIQMRLDQRRDLVQQGLQLQADRGAREQHAARVEQVRGEVLTLEGRREELLKGLTAALRRARELDEAVQRYADLAARVERDEDDLARLTAQLGTLEERLAQARRFATQPDRIEVGGVTVAPVGQDRRLGAGLAGGAGALATWLVCVLMIARPPWRRPTTDQVTELLGAGAAPDERKAD